MKVGISITTQLSNILKSLRKNPDKLGEIYLTSITNTLTFIDKYNLNYLELISVPPFDSELLTKIERKLAKLIEDKDTIFHLPSWEVDISAMNKGMREAAVNELKKQIDIISNVGVGKFAIHPGSFGSLDYLYKALEEHSRKIILESILQLRDYCKKCASQLFVENLPYHTPLFTRPEEFDKFVEYDVPLVLDTSHAVTAGQNPVDFLKRFKEAVVEIHLVDGFLDKPDKHYALGDGDVNLDEIVKTIKKLRLDPILMLEVVTPQDIEKSMKKLKEYKVV